MPLYQSSTVAVGNSTVNATGLSISNTLIANDVGLLVGTNTALVSVNSTAIKVGNSTVNIFVVQALLQCRKLPSLWQTRWLMSRQRWILG